MKKSDLKQGMCVQTIHNRYGFIELDCNRIDFCYDPDVLKDEYTNLEKVSLDDVFEYGDNQLGIGCIVTKELLYIPLKMGYIIDSAKKLRFFATLP